MIAEYTPMAQRIGRALAGLVHLPAADAQQEAVIGLIKCIDHYPVVTPQLIRMCVRNHLLRLSEKTKTAKRTGQTVLLTDNVSSDNTLNSEVLAIAADREQVIGERCQRLGMGVGQTLALLVCLFNLSRSDESPDQSLWLELSNLSPEQAAGFTKRKARRLLARLIEQVAE
jgi:hypothetical protein